ncbi:MAG: hypothetical protein ACJ746_29255 [Bryobacteraceae bacterium]
MVLRHPAAILLVAILLVACGNGLKSKEKVQAAIMDRIQNKTGLDLKGLDLTTTSVSFEKNMAYATVAFHPKGDTSVSHGMEMKYTLEQRDGQWQVVNVSDPHGNPAKSPSGMGSGQLPPGHPSVDSALPGHPGEIPGARQGGQTR